MTVANTCSHILVGGYDISGDMTGHTVNYGSEQLDATTYGSSTRKRKGGLKVATMEGAGFVNLDTSGQDAALWARVGTEATVVSMFPHGINGGDTDGGHAMSAAFANYTKGGAVGALLPFNFSAESCSDLIQSVVLWNALSTPWSTDSTGGTIYPVSTAGWSTGERLFGGIHITALSTSLGNVVSVAIQQASSSGAGFTAAATNRLTFSTLTCKTGSFAVPITTHSTDKPFWRAMVTVTSGTSTGASASGLVYLGMQP